MKNENQFLDINGKSLFYPCAGNDFREPIKTFSPHIRDFWFVDRGYFTKGHQDTKYWGLDKDANEWNPVLANAKEYQFIGKTIFGQSNLQRYTRDIPPCILTQKYLHLPTCREIRLHFRRGYGFSAFRNENIGELGVFFYRGDSMGDGGSGNIWLNREHLLEIVSRLCNNGLIVTDGSQVGWDKSKRLINLYQYKRKTRQEMVPIIKSGISFLFENNFSFECIGQTSIRYGPTLIWQVKSNISRNTNGFYERLLAFDNLLDLK